MIQSIDFCNFASLHPHPSFCSSFPSDPIFRPPVPSRNHRSEPKNVVWVSQGGKITATPWKNERLEPEHQPNCSCRVPSSSIQTSIFFPGRKALNFPGFSSPPSWFGVVETNSWSKQLWNFLIHPSLWSNFNLIQVLVQHQPSWHVETVGSASCNLSKPGRNLEFGCFMRRSLGRAENGREQRLMIQGSLHSWYVYCIYINNVYIYIHTHYICGGIKQASNV